MSGAAAPASLRRRWPVPRGTSARSPASSQTPGEPSVSSRIRPLTTTWNQR